MRKTHKDSPGEARLQMHLYETALGFEQSIQIEGVFPIISEVYSSPLTESGTYSQNLQGYPVYLATRCPFAWDLKFPVCSSGVLLNEANVLPTSKRGTLSERS